MFRVVRESHRQQRLDRSLMPCRDIVICVTAHCIAQLIRRDNPSQLAVGILNEHVPSFMTREDLSEIHQQRSNRHNRHLFGRHTGIVDLSFSEPEGLGHRMRLLINGRQTERNDAHQSST